MNIDIKNVVKNDSLTKAEIIGRLKNSGLDEDDAANIFESSLNLYLYRYKRKFIYAESTEILVTNTKDEFKKVVESGKFKNLRGVMSNWNLKYDAYDAITGNKIEGGTSGVYGLCYAKNEELGKKLFYFTTVVPGPDEALSSEVTNDFASSLLPDDLEFPEKLNNTNKKFDSRRRVYKYIRQYGAAGCIAEDLKCNKRTLDWLINESYVVDKGNETYTVASHTNDTVVIPIEQTTNTENWKDPIKDALNNLYSAIVGAIERA